MNNLIVILGNSGMGKSTSIRNLNPDETFIINILNKPLPIRGFHKFYNEEKQNYLETDNWQKIANYLKAVNDRRPEIKNIVIDDFTFIMNNEYMRRCRERSFDKFSDIGKNNFDLLEIVKGFRPDLYCFIMSHTESDHSGLIKARTVGKMTNDYVGICERSLCTFHALIIDMEYKFLTNNDSVHSARTAPGMFDELYIDNDLQMIRNKIQEYYYD